MNDSISAAPRVLVVDDQPDSADALTLLINMLGYEAKAIYDGRSAAAEVAAFAPDMVLIDIGMPVMNGYETVASIRMSTDTQRIILVAVTGWVRDDDKCRALEAGFDRHVSKPVSLEMLNELLALLGQSAVAS